MRRNLFWLSDEQWERIEAHLPTDVRGVERQDDRRVISGIVQVLKSGCRWCDCPPEYGPHTTIYNRFVRWARRGIWEKPVPQSCRERTIHRHADDRFHARESAPLGSRRKRGEKKQAVGRSRGGRNTKIHALADAKGRLIAILVTGGQAHDCPVAERLIRRVKRQNGCLATRHMTAMSCAKSCMSAAPSRSFPTATTGNSPFLSANASTSCAGASRLRSTGSKTSGVSRPVTTSWRETTWPLSASSLLLYGGFNESEP